MTSYHEYNKVEKARALVERMREGVNVALITDAGTPGISDPGEELVRQCYEAGLEVTSLPGPAACITALTMSGLSTRRFCFEAFLPADSSARRWGTGGPRSAGNSRRSMRQYFRQRLPKRSRITGSMSPGESA